MSVREARARFEADQRGGDVAPPKVPGPKVPLGPKVPIGGPKVPPGGPKPPTGGPKLPLGGHKAPLGGPKPPVGGPKVPPGGPKVPPGAFKIPSVVAAAPPPRQVKENIPVDPWSPVRALSPRRPSGLPRHLESPHQVRIPLSPRHPLSPRMALSPRMVMSPRIEKTPVKPFSPSPPMFSPSPKLQGTPCRRPSNSNAKGTPRLKPPMSPLIIRTSSPSSNSSRPLISPPFPSVHSPDLSNFEEKVRPSPIKRPEIAVARPPSKPPPRPPLVRSSSQLQTPSEVFQSPQKRSSPHGLASPLRPKSSPSPVLKQKSPPIDMGFNHEKQRSAAERLVQIRHDILANSHEALPPVYPHNHNYAHPHGGHHQTPNSSNKSAEQLYDELKESFAKKLAKDREERMEMMAALSAQAEERRAIEKANMFFNHLPVEGVLTVVPHGKLKGLKPAKKRQFSLHIQTRTLSYWKDENTRLRGVPAKTLEQVTGGEASSSQAATFCIRFRNRISLEVKASTQADAQRWLDALALLKHQGSPSKMHRKSSSSGNGIRSGGSSFSSEKRGSVDKLGAYEDVQSLQQQEAIRGAFRDAFRFQLVSSGNKAKAPPRTSLFGLGNG